MSAVNVFGDNWRRTMDKQTKAAVLDAVKERFHAEMMFYDQAHQQAQSVESLSKQWNHDTSSTNGRDRQVWGACHGTSVHEDAVQI